jgi:Uma2 family endonuclease
MSEAPVAEYLDGRRYRKVSPRSSHSRVQGLLCQILNRCGSECGIAGPEWDFKIGIVDATNSLLVPDVAFVTFERLMAVDADQREELPIAPDIAAEVWSPKNSRAFLNRKIARYLACGTQLVLDVHPVRRTITAHALDGVRTYTEHDSFEHPSVPWLHFDVADAFVGLEYLIEKHRKK